MTTLRPRSVEEKAAKAMAFVLAGFTLIVIVSARWPSDPEGTPEAISALQTSRQLIFADAEEGSIIVNDAETGALVNQFQPGENGFIRTALRALFYTRKMHGVAPTEPIVLARIADGQVYLYDPSTDKTINLDAFGGPNAAQFEALFKE